MSNLTPDDVDLRLTATKAELTEEDQRLWLGLEDEKISRIAGDEANKQFTELVKQQNSGTESRLSTEVIHRSEGDVSNLNSLNAVAQALSDYRIKTDLEINNEVIARKALGVELNSRIDSFVSTWDHQKYLIYQAIQDVQDDIDGKYASMDTRIVKYEQMLSDITADSIQITTDNGEINMGAWTILSQAREWDLQIIGRMKDFQVNTQQDLNQALEDIQSKLPVEQNIIDKAIQGLSNSQVIKDLDEKLTSSIADIGAINQDLLKEVTARQNEMIAQAQNTANALQAQADELSASVSAEANERIEALLREADIRTLQIEGINSSISEETEERIEEIRLLNDGLTAEVNSRVEGDLNITTSLNNYKESNDTALANVMQRVEVAITGTTANAEMANSLDARLTVAEGAVSEAKSLAATANSTATVAVDATTVLAERMDSVEGSITTVTGVLESKADVIAFNSLKTDVSVIDGKVASNTANIASITGSIVTLDNALTLNANTLNEVRVVQDQQGEQYNQLASSVTALSADVAVVKGDLNTKADTTVTNGLSTQINNLEGSVSIVSSDVTLLKGSLETLEGEVSNKADASALSELNSKVIEVDNRVSVTNSSLLSLEGRVTTAENGIASKLDASVINNYYTKTESDNAIAGKIESYDANLVIGGVNLLKNSEGVFTPSTSKTDNYVIYQSSTVDLVNGKEYTLSGETNGEWDSVHDGAVESNRAVLWLVGNGINAIISNSNVGTKGRTFVWDNPSGTYVLRLNSYKVDNSIWFKNIKIESGNKRTDWTPNTNEVQSAISANATAISSTNTEVLKQDGRITANSNRIDNLSTSIGNLSGSKLDASVIAGYYTKGQVDSKATEIAAGKVEEFKASLNVGGVNMLSDSDKSGSPVILRSPATHFSQYKVPADPEYINTPITQDTQVTLTIWYLEHSEGFGTSEPFTSVTVGKTADGDGWSVRLYKSNAKITKEGAYFKCVGVVTIPAGGTLLNSGGIIIILEDNEQSTGMQLVRAQLEYGNVSTAWSPSKATVNNKIDANASALSTLDSKVTSIDGRVTANTSSVTGLQSTVNNNQANLINSYYTKTSTDIAISNQIASLSATLDMNVLPSKRDLTKANQWLLTHVNPKAAGWVSQGAGVVPDFSILKTGIKYNRIYCADGSTNLSGTEYDNTVLYFRTIVFVHEDKTVNLGSFIGDDAHSIYVNGVLNFTKDGYGPTDNLQLALKQGLNAVDVICYNGGGLAGFISSVLLSSLVVNMYAPESVEEQAAATANAVSSLTATVSDIDGRVASNAGSITNLQAGLTAANNSISTKADSSALNALTARVDSTESGIQATNTSVTSLESKLNNVSVGATNLLPDTKNVGNIGTYLGFGYKRTTRPGGSNQYVDTLGYFVNNLSAGTYVLSFYARANKVQSVNNFFYAPDNTQSAESSTGAKTTSANGYVSLSLTTEWKRYWVRWVIPSDTESKGLVVARLDDYDSSERWVEVAAPKLEKGTLATDWSPATSDTASAAALSTLDTKVTSIDGKVTTHASSITQLQADVSGNSSKLIVQGDVVNGLKASYVVKTDVNGLVTGYGLYNEGGVGAFGVNADYFYVGNGTTATGGKKPFMVLTSAQTIGGVTYPAGTWIDVALIANATIGTAHIADAAITSAKIGNAQINNAHIVNLNAGKIDAGYLNAERIEAKSIDAGKLNVTELSAISADLGTIKVGSANIADLAVTTAKIGDLQVDTLKIKDNAVTVPVYSYTSGIAYIDSSRWATSQSIWAPCSNGVTLFFFNFSYDCRRQDTRYAVKCRILKDGVIVRPEFTIFYFEADANNINVKSRPAGTLSLNHADNTGVDGTFELQFYMSAGNGWNVDNRYTSSLTVRK